ncbi:MAG: hypothetical protein BZ137_03995 [Methanosphaera sp. rholeuAM130]|nr:MAG: hypothetical protein BZ137_03995 [Methanosphaera sp. rholeuAM130]
MKTKAIILFTLLLVVLITATSANDVSDESAASDTAELVENTPTVDDAADSMTTDIVNYKHKTSKEEKNMKTATQSVENYGNLINYVKSAKESNDDEYIIQLQPGNYNATSTIIWGNATGSNRKLIIDGNGQVLDGGKAYQFMEVKSGYSVTLKNITLTHYNTTSGAVIYNNGGSVNITDSNISDNIATSGGAIYNVGGSVIITDSNFTHNRATENGGAICNYEGIIDIQTSNFTENNATNGAALMLQQGSILCNGSSFTQNRASGYGGVLRNTGGNANFTSSTFTDNDAVKSGGVISLNWNMNASVISSTYRSNTPENFIIEDSKIKFIQSDNYITAGDITIYLDNDDTPVYRGSLNGYTVPKGCLIRMMVNNDPSDTFHNNMFIFEPVVDCVVHNYSELVETVENAKTSDSSEYSIALYPGNYNATANMTWSDASGRVRKLIIWANGVTLDGNDRYRFMTVGNNYKLDLKNLTMTHYTAEAGGVIYSNNATININTCNFTQNTADHHGSIIANENGTILKIVNSNFHNNTKDQKSTELIHLEGEDSQNINLYDYINMIMHDSNITDGNIITSNVKNGQMALNISNNNFTNATVNITSINSTATFANVTNNLFNLSTLYVNDNRAYRYLKLGHDTYVNTTNDYWRKYLIKDNILISDTVLTITSNNTNPIIGDSVNLTITLKDQDEYPLERNIMLSVNNQTQQLKTNVKGIAAAQVTFNTARENTITATFEGEYEYLAKSTQLKITSLKIPTGITATVTNNTAKNTTLSVTVNDIHNNKIVTWGQLNITDKDEKIVGSGAINNTGISIITTSINTKGVKKITVNYLENDNYTGSTYVLDDIVVVGRLSEIEFTDDNLTYANTSVNITVRDSVTNTGIANAPIKITYPDATSTQTHTDDDGYYTIKSSLPVGENNITVEFTGNDEYNSTTQTHTITVNKRISKTETNIKNNTCNNTTIEVTVKDRVTDSVISNASVTVTLPDGKAINTTTGNEGRVEVSLKLPVGKNTINVKFNGNNEYEMSANKLTVNVQKSASTTIAAITNKTARNNTITLKVTDKTTKQPVTSGKIEVINRATNKTVAKATITGENTTVTTSINESGTYNLTVKYLGNEYYNASQCEVNNLNIQKRIVTETVKTVNNTLNNTLVNITVTDKTNGKTIPNAQVTIKLPNGTTITASTGTTGTVTQKINLPVGKNTINITYDGSKTYNNISKNHTIDVKKITTKTSITPVTACLGDKITLKVTITAENNVPVNRGNVIFKLNGVTIRDNGKLSGSDNPLKVKVTNGVATTMITADNNMRNANQITAHYIENDNYAASNSTPAKITLNRRNATITVTTNTKTVKQGQNLIITAKVFDTTGGKKTGINSTTYEFVYFKINGVTLKDVNGQMLKANVVNSIASINYTVPLGLSCVTDTQTMTPKNQTILAVFYSKTYNDESKNNTTFQVERSPITINISNATINNRTRTLSMKITIRDYLGNTVAGPNKLVIKVNGLTLKNGTQVMYFYTTDGVLNLKNTPVPQAKNYTTIEVITQDRLAYKSQRNTTKVIKITN